MENIQLTEAVLTRKQAAIFLHCCKTTLDRLGIAHTHLRRKVIYERSVLEQWLAEHREERKPI